MAMHEISLLENVLEILQASAREQGFTRVARVCLEIGELSCVSEDALQFGFPAVMQGTLAEQAELQIRRVKGIGQCRQCRQRVELQTLHDPCPACGSFQIAVVQGREMKIRELQVV